MTDTTIAATSPETQEISRIPAIPRPRESAENRRDRAVPPEWLAYDYGYPAVGYALAHLTLLGGRGTPSDG
ncbi:hypothetical protein [Geodermatophilus sp. URMC 64]